MVLKTTNFINLFNLFLFFIKYVSSDNPTCDINVDNSCLTVDSSKLTFPEAEYSCFKKNGNLAILNSDAKVQALAKFLKGNNVTGAFFGLTDRAQRGIFRWIDGTVLTDEGGIVQQEWTERNVESCIILSSNGKWIKSSCKESHQYICEILKGEQPNAPPRKWTQWVSMDDPSTTDQILTVENIKKKYPSVCTAPDDVECQVVGTGISSNKTADTFQMPCSKNGLICLNSDQKTTSQCQHYQLRFLCPIDIDECATPGMAKCDQNAQCINTYGSFKCVCKSGFSGDGKTCYEINQCVAWGDPHYVSFDQVVHHFMGICSYRLAETCFKDETISKKLKAFRITSANEHRGINTQVSYTKSVSLQIGNLTVKLGKNNILSIDGVDLSPPQTRILDDVQINMFYTTKGMKLRTSFGVDISYDGVSRVIVSVPNSYANQMCGLCGNMNGDQTDEWALNNGLQSNDREQWGNSWMSTQQDDINCAKVNLSLPHNLCDEQSDILVKSKCSVLTDPNGPFSSCHKFVDSQTIYPSCYFDMCTDPKNSFLLCSAYQMYAEKCSTWGIFFDWRKTTGCILKCGADEHYESQISGCQASCTDPNAEDTCHLDDTSGCVCNDGFLRSGTTCKPKEQCGCYDANKNYKIVGDVWFTDSCSTKNRCTGTNSILVDPNVQCHKYGECFNKSDTGESECRCNKGYEGRSDNCTDVDECSLGSYVCSSDGDCINNLGSYNCSCKIGFRGDGLTCTDINECTEKIDKCSPYASCYNTHGSYKCICQNGYEGDGLTCSLIPIISVNPDQKNCSFHQDATCDPLAECTDNPNGSFSCSCIEGSYGDGLQGANHTGCAYAPCPQNSTAFEGYCYRFLPNQVNQSINEEICSSQGGNLATFIDQISLNFISGQLEIFKQNSPLYVGYSSVKFKDWFISLDFSPISVNNWAKGHPKQGLSCVVILPFDAEEPFKYMSVECNEKYGAICKFPSSPRNCASGWREIGNKCMAVFKKKINVTEAAIECARYGGDLVTIQSESESNLIFTRLLKLLSGDFWFGLNKNLLQRSSKPQWWNSTDVSFSNYNETNPNSIFVNQPDIECYRILSTGKWVGGKCAEDARGFLCEKPKNVFQRCPGSSEYFNGKCYKSTTNDTKAVSEKTCLNAGGELISISTFGEQTFLEKYLYSCNIWNSYWIGLVEDQTRVSIFSWSDHTVFEYTNWDKNQPGSSGPGHCVIVDGSNMGSLPWSEKSCDDNYVGMCEYVNTPCLKDSDCHIYGQCHLGQCHCKVGFKGDGLKNCTNINECLSLSSPCKVNEDCVDTIGSYKCNCIENYVQLNNGICEHKLYCLGDADCAKNGKCFQNRCSCNLGFDGDGKLLCADINECLNSTLNKCNESAICTNLAGSYSCACKNGFQGNGISDCHFSPKTCDEYLQQNPNAVSGVYTLDPDGDGPLLPIAVTCEMRPGIGITIITHDNVPTKQIVNELPYSEDRPITYEFSMDYLILIVNASDFCYQDMEFQCSGFLNLIETTSYFDVNGKEHKKWGTSRTENKCGCGELKICGTPEQSCFCDGNYRGNDYDNGRIIDKSLLPLTKILTGGNGYYTTGSISIGPLICSPRPINIPKNCHDAKVNYNLNKNSVIWLDVNLEGPFKPFLALCDVNTKRFGVTIIPHDQITGSLLPSKSTVFPGPLFLTNVTNPKTCFAYNPEDAQIFKLISDSGGCIQEVRYDCQKGSELLNTKAYLQSLSGKNLNYFGSGSNGKCACGVVGSCTSKSSSCNCDGENSGSDFGFIFEKEDLPIKCFIDNNKSPNPSSYSVGPLICAPGPFGMEPSCHEWVKRGYTANYTYLIDTDGGNVDNDPTNQPAYLVNCILISDPPIGITVIPSILSGKTCSNRDDKLCKNTVTYPLTPAQIKPIILRSSYCKQQIKYSCRIMTLLTPYVGKKNPYAFWRTYGADDKSVDHSYFAGDGTKNATCQCGLDKACKTCFCDVGTKDIKIDVGYLLEKSDLPVGEIWTGQDPSVKDLLSQIELGDLECYEVFPSCESTYENIQTTTEFLYFYNTRHTLDPDGPLGESPIVAGCQGKVTYITPEVSPITFDDKNSSNIGPLAQCFNIKYRFNPNPKQIKKLASLSNSCIQYMKFSCKATPLTGYVKWYDIDGVERPGWAGNSDGNECACGEVDSCQGGMNFSCNCDLMSANLLYDHGLLVNKDILPVSKICLGLTEKLPPSSVNRQITIDIDSMLCSPTQENIYPDCQLLRENQYQDPHRQFDPKSEAWIIDPDGQGPRKPFTVYCDMKTDVPVGITVINLKPNPLLCSNETLPTKETSINIDYLAASDDDIKSLASVSSYCEQTVSYDCQNAPLLNGNKYGAYDQSGKYLEYWVGPQDKHSCTSDTCYCATIDDKMRSDSGKFTNKTRLPLSKVSLPSVKGQRKLCVKELRCYNIPRTCEEYEKQQRLDINKGNRDNIWPIDPDQAGGEEYFAVQCKTVDNVIVTETLQTTNPQLIDSNNPSNSTNVSYLTSNMRQLYQLINISNYCSQRLDYFCTNAGTLNNNEPTFLAYNDERIKIWAGADRYNVNGGCACNIMGICPKNGTCRCDALANEKRYEGGLFTDRRILPIKQINYSPSQKFQANVYPVDCGSSIFGLPADCFEALAQGYTEDTEVLIMPNGAEKPFLVYCRMKTELKNVVITEIPNTPTNKPNSVFYPTASIKDIKVLVKNSAYCLQPMKVSCKGIMFSSLFSWTDSSMKQNFDFGTNTPKAFCPCGQLNVCAGIPGESREAMKSRKCSCDTPNYDVNLADAVVITNRDLLPITSVNYSSTSNLKIGSLMCANKKFDFDECKNDFHDCDSHAECTNLENGYKCNCIAGWQGLGGNEMYANGRSCVDDNECALLKCPSVSDCVNTPGSFICNCHAGFVKIGQAVCQDIDECSLNSTICDKNALCTNTYGSYICSCNPGYRGSGQPGDCEAVGTCGCWGDPHCLGFDGNWFHYQGKCKYTLVRDECQNGFPKNSSTPNFEVIMKNWDQNQNTNQMVSWAKEITVKIMNYTIMMKLGFTLTVNGQKTSVPFSPKNRDGRPLGFEVSFYGSTLRLTSESGLEVKWDGSSRVDVTISSKLQQKVCGLCGNYNLKSTDDWIIGPKCEPPGTITDLLNLFGDSWRNDEPVDKDPACSGVICLTTPNEKPCAPDIMTQATLKCQKLRTIFASCEAAMKKFGKSLDDYIESCIYDQCHSTGDLTEMLCKTAESLAQKCLEEYKVNVIFRNENFCNKKCDENMVYSACAPPCQPSCFNSTENMLCGGLCIESCICRPGFVLENGRCIKPETCGCLMPDGTYYSEGEKRTNKNCTKKCGCNRKTSQLECVDITCSNDAFCDFKDDDYGCHCKNGFMGDGIECKDIDECLLKPAVCDINALCNNTIGGHTCKCNEGFEGDGKSCTNINECTPTSPCNNVTEECFDQIPGYDCRCKQGFMKNPSTGKCEDKNECADTGNLCDRVSTECNNTFGSYRCDCKHGFRPDPIDSFVCIDVNECNTVHECDKKYAKCTNTPGSYYCTCNDGFQGDGRNCTDINECNKNQVCQRPDATCVNLPGSYECRCLDGRPGCDGENPCNTIQCNKTHEYCYIGHCLCEKGYIRNNITKECEDLNECETGEHHCTSKKANCENIEGSYQCICMYGYQMTGDNTTCENMNECNEATNHCGRYADCVDTDGGYYCQCAKGFTGHCEECRDIDECALSLNECDRDHATCENSIGSFSCHCNAGYSGDGTICSDIDECQLGLHNCTKSNQFCSNTDGSFKCSCQSGYVLNKNGDCVDENECLYADNGCDENADCINKEGSFNCICRYGYTGSGRICKPEDGFEKCGKNLCPLNSMCINNVCHCKFGYQYSKHQCINIDECVNQTTCDINANCIDTPGSFKCYCKDGYVGNGYNCFEKKPDIDVCKSESFCIDGDCYDGICHCPKGFVYKSNRCIDDRCKNACPPNAACSTSSGSVVCSCSMGTSLSSDNSECIDIDECSKHLDDCQDYSICVNEFGFYDCKCSPGYLDVFGDGKICKFVEQSDCKKPCPVGQYCKNGKCACLPGLISNENGENVTCDKVTKSCLPGTCPLNSVCEERLVGYLCHCLPGYEGVNRQSCQDINECSPNKHSCSKNEDCTNLPGSYNCTCKDGFTRNPKSNQCESSVKCKCGSHGICDSNNKCICKPGYGTNEEGICEDVDECMTQSPCHVLAVCKNTLGSYSCSCPDNYYGDAEVKCIEDKCKTKSLQCKVGEDCIRTLFGTVCKKKICQKTEILVGDDCVPVDKVCQNIKCGKNAVCRIEDGRPDCFCDSGYFGDGEVCVDIDECVSGLVSCPKNSQCQDKEGSFHCACNGGFERKGNNSLTDSCTDIDECKIAQSCAKNSACINTIGSFHCDCEPGYFGDGRYNCRLDSKCEKFGQCHQHAACVVNAKTSLYECQCDSGYSGDGVQSCIKDNLCFNNGNPVCHRNAKCIQTNSTYQCICPSGYQGDGYNFCSDVDECASSAMHNCSALEKCVNNNGKYSCVCGQGTKLENDVCIDINECSAGEVNKCSANGVCHNEPGSYFCVCKDGFYGDGVNCKDIDECTLGLANCSVNALCHNKPGSFACECQAGTLGNGTTCGDEDECKKPRGSPGAAECDENAICKNKDPGYSCECKPGYVGTGWFCIKESPCNKPNACSVNQTCNLSDDYSSVVCECKSDFKLDNGLCVPKQECNTGTDNCDRRSSDCIQFERGYKCQCKPGFNLVGNVCIDKNECDPKSPDYAGQECTASGGGCFNTVGSFVCTCNLKKAKEENTRCIPINPCVHNMDQCNRTVETCIFNKDYTYTCKCIEGYEKDNGICVDVDECKLKLDSCKNNATCVNTEGSYFCTCPGNLRLSTSKKSCVDRNECLENPTICGDRSKCVNKEGSYECACVPGFKWNGVTCEDIDECVNNSHPCHKFAQCSNIPGSCTCKCGPGYTGDGIYQCSEIDSCPSRSDVKCPESSFCNILNDMVYCNCTNGYSDAQSLKCVGDVCYKDCSDINECLTNKSVCHKLAKCMNSQGSFVCVCPPHLIGDGKVTCEDQNECAIGAHTCNLNISYCENLDNAADNTKPYQCNCFNGYTKIPGTEACINKNECLNPAENNCGENSQCIDTEGSFECRCEAGFKQLPNSRCVDIDECAEKFDECSLNSVCENTIGNYRCKCNPGFQVSNTNSLVCEDTDECQNPTTCLKVPDSICVNNPSSFECVCPVGMTLQGGSCLDNNECLIPNICGVNGTCSNTKGSFKCSCPNNMKQLSNGNCESINECQDNVDRCKERNGPNSACYDLPDGYGCTCPVGFINDKKLPEICVDLDECSTNTHNCIASNSICVNTYGSFSCNCKSGFSKDKLGGCTDIDECEVSKKEDLDICNSGKCVNTEGSYLCYCPPGYTNDTNHCTDIDECLLDPVSKLAGKCNDINGKCINTKGSYKCICKDGYQISKDSSQCQDIDECSFPNACLDGICNNLPGSYECICNKTFTLINGKCMDRDECQESPMICGQVLSGVCINTHGSHQCKCNVGFENSGGKSTNPCQAINECAKYNVICPPNAQCVDRSTGYECVCKNGYKEDQIGLCRNINECEIESSCHYLADCTDTDGSYECSCKYGYKGDGKVSCKAICDVNSCPSTQICKVVNRDQFECGCQCQGDRCSESGPVCDSNGITYLSAKQMFETTCKQKLAAEIEYYHECQKSCDNVICPGTEVCSISSGRPICSCQKCTEDDIESGVVCSSSGVEFANICQLKTWICETKSLITVGYRGHCRRPIDCTLSEWSSWSVCSRTCGIGKFSRKRQLMKPPLFNGKCDLQLIETQQCFNGPCPGDACEKITCPTGSFCEAGKCICPDCSNQETAEPVCGKVGDTESGTFRTFCTMVHNACELNATYTYLHKGECGEHVPAEPKICSLVTNFKIITSTGNCTSTEPIRTNQCSGGCGKNANYCCRALTTRTLRAKFKCPDNSFTYREVQSISSCHCKLEESSTNMP